MRLALLTMLLLLGFAWHFYLERAAYYDLAWHIFNYLKNKSLFVVNRRFVAMATQWPPLLAIKSGLPLEQVLRLYSVVFMLYYLGVFLVCAYWIRNEQMALVVVFLFVLLASRTFYSVQSELSQALVALVMFYAGIARQTPIQFRWGTLALLTLIPVFIFGHPLCVLPFLFIWAYDWALNRRFRDWGYYGVLVLALAVQQLRTALIPAGSYEDNQMTFVPNVLRYFPHYLSLESFSNFWALCRKDLFPLPVLLVAITAYYLTRRDWLAWVRLLLVWGFAAGYVFIVNVSKPGYTEPTYLENLYLPLTFFVAIPLAAELLPALERHWHGQGAKWAAGVLALLLLVRVGLIWYRHVPYTAYQQWLKQVLAYTYQFPERKFVLYPDNVDPHRLRAGWPWWAMASETLVLSARHSPDSVQSIRVGWDVDQLVEAGARPGVLLEPFEASTIGVLPANYARFPANTQYRSLNTQAPGDTAALRPYIAAHAAVRLTPLDELPKKLAPNQHYKLRLRIEVPATARPLHSGIRGPHPTLLRTVFYKAHDWPTDVAALEAPLEVDVWTPWTQTVPVEAPHQPGHYTLEVALISKDYQPWPVRVRIPVDVE